ncbi:hypothetical protein H0H92_003272 [Tricholoma furcatifolium]|nr:hypothetical protein H0H92_003272 [Tricholoma furcatifolium]
MPRAQKKSDNSRKPGGRRKVGEWWDYVAVDDDVSQLDAQEPIDINAPRQTCARPTADPLAVLTPAPADSARPHPRKVMKSANPVLPADPDDPFIVRRKATHKQIETFEPPPPTSARLNNAAVTPPPPPPNQLSLSAPGRPLKVIPTFSDDEDDEDEDDHQQEDGEEDDGNGNGDDNPESNDEDKEEEEEDGAGDKETDEDEDDIEEALELFIPREAYKSGPLPLDALEELHTFYEEFQHKTIALTKKINKPPEVLFSQQLLAAGHNVSIWSVFLAWRAKNGPPKPADVAFLTLVSSATSEWPKMLAVEYEAFINDGLDGKPNTPAN